MTCPVGGGRIRLNHFSNVPSVKNELNRGVARLIFGEHHLALMSSQHIGDSSCELCAHLMHHRIHKAFSYIHVHGGLLGRERGAERRETT